MGLAGLFALDVHKMNTSGIICQGKSRFPKVFGGFFILIVNIDIMFNTCIGGSANSFHLFYILYALK